MKQDVAINLNGEIYTGRVELRTVLVDFIREVAGLTGIHVGCGFEGRCGSCTVILEGVAVKSCLMLAIQADGAKVLTPEGLARGGELHPLQTAFRDHHGLQCGFCTPGFLMTLYDYVKDIVARGEVPDEVQIRQAMAGVLCRCTGYVNIVAAVRQTIDRLNAMTPAERQKWFPL